MLSLAETHSSSRSEKVIPRFKPSPTSSHSFILRAIGQGAGRRVLDVGCADGFLAQRLAERGWEVTGLERNPDLAQRARRFCEQVIVADLNRQVPAVPGLYDAIVFGDVLEHCAEPDAVFRQICRALAPEGQVVVSAPNIAHLSVRWMLLTGRFEYADRGILDRTHLRFFTRKSLRHFLEQNGVCRTEWVPVPAPVELVVPERWHGVWLRGLQRVHAAAARCWPGGLAYQFVVKGSLER